MTDAVNNPEPQSTGPAEATANSQNPKAQPEAVTGNTKISSIEDLKNKAPEVWKQMIIGIAMTICKKMEKGQQRIKEAMRKAREVK